MCTALSAPRTFGGEGGRGGGTGNTHARRAGHWGCTNQAREANAMSMLGHRGRHRITYAAGRGGRERERGKERGRGNGICADGLRAKTDGGREEDRERRGAPPCCSSGWSASHPRLGSPRRLHGTRRRLGCCLQSGHLRCPQTSSQFLPPAGACTRRGKGKEGKRCDMCVNRPPCTSFGKLLSTME